MEEVGISFVWEKVQKLSLGCANSLPIKRYKSANSWPNGLNRVALESDENNLWAQAIRISLTSFIWSRCQDSKAYHVNDIHWLYKRITIPFRDTVAGDALSMLWGSKIILQVAAIGKRSPLARVRVLLSSKTEFKFSIQILSTGPSRTSQTYSP